MTSGHTRLRLSCADYHVAWVCALADVELLPARLMLDEEHPTPSYNTHYDENTYICGSISGHAVVIATCPQGETGNVNAGRLTGSLFKTFPSIRVAVLVGIGGGIPRTEEDAEDSLNNIHLGDVVVGWPGDGKPACVYHDRGRSKPNGEFEMVGTMQSPDWRLINALGILVSDHELEKTTFDHQLARLRRHKLHRRFAHPGVEHDRLFKASYSHVGNSKSNCAACDYSQLVQRPQRTEQEARGMVFHQGRVATGNSVIRDGKLRDDIGIRCDGALCVEMEAAGVDVNRRCLVIRGISDYADSHKSDLWQSHAAGNAAAFTRELLCRLQTTAVQEMQGVVEVAPWLVPLARPQSFVGREPQLDKIAKHIMSEKSNKLSIYGLGGCGKTALALEVAYRTREQQPECAIFWVPAVNREHFEQAYRDIAEALHIPGVLDDQTDVKQLVKVRLSDERTAKWLMIVDNADDAHILFSKTEKDELCRLIDFLPHSSKGSIVFTTRTKKVAVDLSGNSLLAIGELEKTEAIEVLKTRLDEEHEHQLEDETIVTNFLETVAFLALAIVQAVAFINKNGVALTDYIILYKSSEEEASALLSKEFEEQGRYSETENSIATTWFVSFEQIRRQDELASAYLCFMACVISNDIPKSMLLDEGSDVEQIEAIGTLKAYAFISERQNLRDQNGLQAKHQERTFDIHPLVHLAIRIWIKACGQWRVWVERTLDRLLEIVPLGDHSTIQVWTAYLPHAVHTVSQSTDVPDLDDEGTGIYILERIGWCEFVLGRYRASELARRKVVEWRMEVLGREHIHTLTAMNNLALTLGSLGKYQEAETMHRETSTLQKKLLGRENTETITCMSNLALVLSNLGDYGEAESIHRENVILRGQVLGENHPDTLTSMNCLTHVLKAQRRYEEAETLTRETLRLRENVLGEKHPHTLATLHSLASLLAKQRKYAGAEQMGRLAYEGLEKALGKDHPDTLMCMNNLAYALQKLGKLGAAKEMYQLALGGRERTLGDDHPFTVTSAYNLGHTFRELGDDALAEEMYWRAVKGYEKALGDYHFDTLNSVHSLASALQASKRLEAAEYMYRRALNGKEKTIGKDHHSTIRTVRHLADLLRCMHRYEEAVALYQRASAVLTVANGLEHSETQYCLSYQRELEHILHIQTIDTGNNGVDNDRSRSPDSTNYEELLGEMAIR
ncbi:unnamed protein product [Periconia digitata]|uniref:Kinesin light chain n=1 Tax=Periconia digitata TaxID=1303443 RepID=A0A9W4XJB1_9PLEO|nr:unnamed protein product [Periconia digitata]